MGSPNFLFYGHNCISPTDGVIFVGCRKLLKRIYPNCSFGYLSEETTMLRDCTLMTDEQIKTDGKFDAIIVGGSPFLWHYYYKSIKLKNLLRTKELHNCPIIWLGIGSCLPLNHLDLFDKTHLEETNKIFKDELVIVRDSLAKDLFTKSGVDSTHLVCPSYFSTSQTQKTKENLIVFYEPTIGISQQAWTDSEQLEEYYEIFTEFAKRGADVVVKDVEEVEFAQKLGFNPRVLVDVDDCLETVGQYQTILSGRVHCGVPGLISGANLGIIPVDTRHLTITDFADCGIRSKNDLDLMKELCYNYENDFNVYEKLIKDFLD